MDETAGDGWKEIVTLPSLRSLRQTKMTASVGLKRENILSPVRSNLRITDVDGFSFALLFKQFNQVLVILHFVRIQIMRHNFVANHHSRNNKSGTVSRSCFDKLCLFGKYGWCYFVSRNTLKSLA